MLEKLLDIERQYLSLQDQLMDPAVMSDMQQLRSLGKKSSDLEELYHLTQEYKVIDQQLNDAKEMLAQESDPEMIELAQTQLNEAQVQLPDLEQRIKVALLPKDPNDDKNIFLEIRPAA
jgi:peptide chain release factor 1